MEDKVSPVLLDMKISVISGIAQSIENKETNSGK